MITNSKIEMTKLEMARRIWIIHDILDNPLTQKNILKLWRNRGEVHYRIIKKLINSGRPQIAPNMVKCTTIKDIKVWKPKKFSDGIGISKGTLSKIINGYMDGKGNYHVGLIEEGLIKKDFVEGEIGYSLVESVKSLHRILIEFSNHQFSLSFIRDMRNDLMNSEYIKKLINTDLVKKLEYIKDENELNFILTLIKISPSALLEFLEEVKYCRGFPNGFLKSLGDDRRRSLLMKLQFHTYYDFNFIPTTQRLLFKPPYPVKIEFDIKTNLKTKKGTFEHLSTLQLNSFELLSIEEQKEQIIKSESEREYIKSLKLQGDKLKKDIYPKSFPDLKEENQQLDKKFNLDSSPLTYEKNLS